MRPAGGSPTCCARGATTRPRRNRCNCRRWSSTAARWRSKTRWPATACAGPVRFSSSNGDFGLTLSRGLTDLTIRRASFETAEPGLTVAELSGRWIARNGRHDVRDLHLRTAASAVDGQFVLQPAAPPRERASLSTRLMLAPIALTEFDGLVPALEGRPLVLTGPLNVEGPLDALAIKANLADPQAGAVRADVVLATAGTTRTHPRPARHHPSRSGADPQGQGAGQPPHVERPHRSRLYRRLVVGAAERHGGRAVVELDDLGLPLGQRARPRAHRAARPHARRRRPRLRRQRHRERHDRAVGHVPSATRWQATWTVSTCAGCRSSCACRRSRAALRAITRSRAPGRGSTPRPRSTPSTIEGTEVRRRRHRTLQQPRRHAALRVHRSRDACRRPTLGARARRSRRSAATTTRRASPDSWPWTAPARRSTLSSSTPPRSSNPRRPLPPPSGRPTSPRGWPTAP